jgi:hypothetical protein
MLGAVTVNSHGILLDRCLHWRVQCSGNNAFPCLLCPHVVRATPYASTGGTGAAGTTIVVIFSIVSSLLAPTAPIAAPLRTPTRAPVTSAPIANAPMTKVPVASAPIAPNQYTCSFSFSDNGTHHQGTHHQESRGCADLCSGQGS